jgi:DNA-binding transcriptional MerR regulator
MPNLPPKLYFRIGEVATLVGVEPHVLRYWEREFRSIRPTKSAKGQRVYSRRDVESLIRVRELLYGQGFTIAGAKKKLQKHGVEPDEAEPESASAPELTPAPSASIEAPHPTRDVARMRAALLEVRGEIESLLDELGP